MNYSIMNERELIKYADPQTDLEKALLAVVVDGLESVADIERELEQANSFAHDFEADNEALKQDIEDMQGLAREALDFIGSQELENKPQIISKLTEIINT